MGGGMDVRGGSAGGVSGKEIEIRGDKGLRGRRIEEGVRGGRRWKGGGVGEEVGWGGGILVGGVWGGGGGSGDRESQGLDVRGTEAGKGVSRGQGRGGVGGRRRGNFEDRSEEQTGETNGPSSAALAYPLILSIP